MDKTMIRIIGIDPGGAIAEIDIDGNILNLFDMPFNDSGLSIRGLDSIFDKYTDKDRCAIETTSAMKFTNKDGSIRAQSQASMLEYGTNRGIIVGRIQATKMRYIEVHSRTWQAVYKVKGKQKGHDSIDVCSKIFPDAELLIPSSRAKDGFIRKDGRSDALLIADYLRRQILLEQK
jgi:hypothetical protein